MTSQQESSMHRHKLNAASLRKGSHQTSHRLYWSLCITIAPSHWVSEQFLDGTSAQSDHTVPFTSVYAQKYVPEDKSKTDDSTLQKLNTTQKSKQHKTRQNKTILVQSPHTTLGQETRWAYSTALPSPHGALSYWNVEFKSHTVYSFIHSLAIMPKQHNTKYRNQWQRPTIVHYCTQKPSTACVLLNIFVEKVKLYSDGSAALLLAVYHAKEMMLKIFQLGSLCSGMCKFYSCKTLWIIQISSQCDHTTISMHIIFAELVLTIISPTLNCIRMSHDCHKGWSTFS